MNTKIYKQVYGLAGELLAAAEANNDEQFQLYYDQLKAVCFDNEGSEQKNHPVQWETLADFTEDIDEALSLYDKALECAADIEASDYLASINFTKASLLLENQQINGYLDKALAAAQQANQYAPKIEDGELQTDIAKLLKKLLN
jgi:hypothetical protein